MEAPSGFEPENEGFADLCLTSWLWCHGLRLSRAISIYQKARVLATDFENLARAGSFFARTQLFGEFDEGFPVRQTGGVSEGG